VRDTSTEFHLHLGFGTATRAVCHDTSVWSQQFYSCSVSLWLLWQRATTKSSLGGEEKRASQLLSEMRLGGINISELAREGLKEKLREVLSNEERVELHQQ